MEINLKGKSALVCGSTQGIGRAIAVELAELGANVILLARDPKRLEATVRELDTGKGQKHSTLCADFSKPADVKKVVTDFLAGGRVVEILVNNTGGPPSGPTLELPVGDFEKAFAMHLSCSHLLVQALAPGMKKAGYGRIINIVSTSVKQPIPDLGISNAVRAAVANWAKTLAGELGSSGITVNNVLPGSTATERIETLLRKRAERGGKNVEEMRTQMLKEIPAGRFAKPEEIAYAVAFLASPEAAYINGVNLPVDGGRIPTL